MHRLPPILGVLATSMLVSMSSASADVVYSTILQSNQSVTGVRGDGASGVVLTGSLGSSSPQGSLYVGPLAGGGTTYTPAPTFSGETVTTSNFYSADTHQFNPSIDLGNVRVVGTYQYTQTPSGVLNHGLLYDGAPSGGGTWTQLDLPSASVGGATVANTIPHSIMGSLVVGDYDLDGVPASGNAFIFNLDDSTWTTLEIGGSTSNLTSAYGIWQNGVGSTSYTIAGGSKDAGVNKAFLVSYDSVTKVFSHLTYYDDSGAPGITHFEGITGVPGGYNLVGTTTDGAAFASVPLNLDGSFGSATWTAIDYPASLSTTGNTVYENVAMGIYFPSGGGGSFNSYTAVVPEPRQWAVALAGLMGALIVRRRRSSARRGIT